LFSPQIISICDDNLSVENYPPLEVLQKGNMQPNQIYLIYNSVAIYMYVGQQTDPYFLEQIFKVQDYRQIDKSISEEEIFADIDSSSYLAGLHSILEQIRYLRVPYCELQILLQGEIDSENIVKSCCILDEDCNNR